MAISLIDIISNGGCYWKRERYDSPGHSIAIPNDTDFRIAVEGPQSHRFVAGKCRNGYFVVTEGEHAGMQYESANEVVNSVREPSSNAFLFLHFRMENHWVSADEMRRAADTQLDEAEEKALADALEIVRAHPKTSALDRVQATQKAAQLVSRNPQMVETARQYLAALEIKLD